VINVHVYDIIRKDLHSLNLHTRMLEECEWDEQLLEKNIEVFITYISNVFFPKNFTWEMMKETISSTLKSRVETNLIEIFIEVLESEKDMMIKQMVMEEN